MKMSWLVKGERDKYTIIVGDYTPLLATDSTSTPKKKKISKNIKDINNTINQFDLLSIHRLSHPSNNRIHTISKYTGNIHQNGAYAS